MDAFYVSVELQRRPELRGLPVVVAGSGPRAVVTTASYEARRFGVFSATPAERARRMCPDAIFVTPDFDHYRARSRDVMAVLRSHVERVEVVGLDEAYLDLTGLDRYRSAARPRQGRRPDRDRAHVLYRPRAEQAGGQGRLGCREAGRVRGAHGRGGADPLRRGLAGLVPGIGPKTVARLGQLGIATLGRLGSTSDAQLSEWFGLRLGPHLGALARFEDERLIETVRVAKSESRETTFDRDLNGLPQLEPVLERLTSELCETLARAERRGRTIGIKVRFDDFTTVTRARSLDLAVNHPEAVGTVALDLLRRLDPARPVRLLGVRVAGLDEESAQAVADDQLTLSL